MKNKSIQDVTVKFPDCHCKSVQQTLPMHGFAHHSFTYLQKNYCGNPLHRSVEPLLLHSHTSIGAQSNTQDAACAHLSHSVVT
jgi:hypothetical protein